ADNLPPTRVVVTGKAAGAGLMAQDEARADARRNAVAQACGVFVDAYSKVEGYELVRDRILEHSRGYLTGYDVKREWVEGGISYCEIIATVDAVRLKDTWEREFAQLREEESNPRTVLIIIQDDDTTDLVPPQFGGACQARLEAHLRSHDVLLLDQQTLDAVRDRDIVLASANADIAAMAARAAEFSADLLLFGQAEATPLGPVDLGSQTIYRHQLTLSMRVIQADSAQVLTSNTYPAFPHRTFGPGCDQDGFAKLADEVADQLLQDVNEAWKKRATSRRIFRVVLQDCSRRDFREELLPEFLKMRGVQQGPEGVKLREVVSGQVSVDIYWAFDLNTLADKLELISTANLSLEIIEQSANRIVAKVIRKG
ncbi:MAG: hypothetical protein KJ749_05170, partial [Planctomycetes bacterium]|nr:hypothetical protein [Planctomycetota bacterium]